MKKTISILVVVLTFMLNLPAQNQTLVLGNTGTKKNDAVLVSHDEQQTTIRFEINELELLKVETGYGNAFITTSDNAPLIMEQGSPELFYLTSTFIISDVGGSELQISYGAYTDFANIEIAPSKGILSRSINPDTIPFVKGEVYQIDAFYPETLATLREPFIMRDVRGQSVDVFPIQYNPVTKLLRIYSEITITVTNTQTKGTNEFINQKRHQTIDPAFDDIYRNFFVNYGSLSGNYPTGEDGELLIICHPAFMADMKPYVDWKRTIGRKTTIVPTSAITPLTPANIKTYISNFYNNPNHNLAYVLLVGDAPQIPTHRYKFRHTGNPN